MDTPEFLIWSLEQACAIRGFQDGTAPQRTERQLRAARAASNARREGRICEEICVDPPDGFRIDEALSIFGGLEAVEQACGTCPANALARQDARSLAGCFGLLPLPSEASRLHDAVDQTIDRLAIDKEIAASFAPTTPRWYGLWLNSPLHSRNMLVVLHHLLAAIQIDDVSFQRGLNELRLGMEAAICADLRLHVRLYPCGRASGPWWRLVPHCPRCHAPWSVAAQRCRVCGHVGHAAPDKKRHVRGRRPYFPLARLLGEQQAADFLVRYEVFRRQQGSLAQAQSQPRAKPPDSPPAD